MGTEIIDKQVMGVAFGFYRPCDIEALSVVRVMRDQVFDNLGQPVPHGVYDARMGPLEPRDVCITCQAVGSQCPGHMGHVKLSVPVYHPLLFGLLYKVIRAKCFYCHRLKLSKTKQLLALTKFTLIDAGLLIEAKKVDDLMMELVIPNSGARSKPKKSKKPKSSGNSNKMIDDAAIEDDEGEESAENSEEEQASELSLYKQQAKQQIIERKLESLQKLAKSEIRHVLQKTGSTPILSSAEHAYRSDIIRDFMRDININKCSHCGAFSPRIRKDGHTKLFRLPLNFKEKMANMALNIHVESVHDQIFGDRDANDQSYNQLPTKSKAKDSQDSKQQKNSSHQKRRRSIDVTSSDSDSNENSSDSEFSQSDEEIEDKMDDALLQPEDVRPIKNRRDNTLLEPEDMEGEAVQDALKSVAENKRNPVLLFPTEVEKHLSLLWERQRELLSYVFGSLSNSPLLYTPPQSVGHHMFFLQILAVPASRFRPPNRIGDMVSEHPQNVHYKTIIGLDNKISQLASTRKQAAETFQWNLLVDAWLALQMEVNLLVDSSKAPNPRLQAQTGIRQVFEKKEGLFRRNMMGKRVNFAARSVISPDPFLRTDEIGVPEMFAVQLTYPEPVTPYNITWLRQCVINGPDVHPGANFVEDANGRLINLSGRNRQQRIAISRTLRTDDVSQENGRPIRGRAQSTTPGNTGTNALGVKRVLRHLRTGDVMLVNRQPTLHKPSMMAHRVRVLHGRSKMWQTIRMHYANCNTYNADFDGDEMNLHVPQNPLARAEAYHIANTDNQYVVPTDGSPLRGLIQDNVLTGVLLTMIDTWFPRDTYQQLLYSCVEIGPTVALASPIPAILKPVPLYSGKQVIGGVLSILTHGRPPLNLVSKAKVPAASWGQHKEESQIIIRENELLQGVLDKSSFGDAPYGLVHAVYELYGAQTAGQLLSTLGRLFTLYLQSQGFTCGIADMLIVEQNELARRNLIAESIDTGIETAADFAEIPKAKSKGFGIEVNIALQKKLRDRTNADKLDGVMKAALNPFTSKIIAACLPSGQYKAFPTNCMSMMTQSGAKGSQVNFSQISCLLGQQELEGRRVPLMATGKTLPSFRKYDPQPRAGGFVTDRFLTGIRPQEYFFHCMAGREGLIDTAVKTSRSGYLQRCLIKHLESLCVQYDYTVRDTDGGVVQFYYGEDGIDVGRTAYMDRFNFLTTNWLALLHKLNPAAALKAGVDSVQADQYVSAHGQEHDPVMSVFPPGSHLGSISEKYADEIENYIESDPDHVFEEGRQLLKAREAGKQQLIPRPIITPDKFRALMKLNYMNSLSHPGESVGILASQSVGEPSTQMTLNTFHLAGHGGANVTLGIPRLREIIMTASASIKTPIMQIPLLSHCTRTDADRIASSLNRLSIVKFIDELTCKEKLETSDSAAVRVYTIRLAFKSMTSDEILESNLSFSDFRHAFEQFFVVKLNAAVKKEIRNLSKSHAFTPVILSQKESDENGSKRRSRSKANQDDEDAVTEKIRSKKHESASYEDPDDDEKLEIAASSESEDESEDETEKENLSKQRIASTSDDEDEDESIEFSADSETSGIVETCTHIRSITYDPKETYAEVAVMLSIAVPKLLMMSMVESLLDSVLLRSTPNIYRAFVTERPRSDGSIGKEVIVQTDGVNFSALARFMDDIDITRVYSNDIAAILRTYGVEAARLAITKEVTSVFAVYGISVDARHLSLIADYMTQNGGFRPLNRKGIDDNVSPFQKISFETSIGFLKEACLTGDVDRLTSPSSRIVIGKPPSCGTGIFDLFQPLEYLPEEEEEEEPERELQSTTPIVNNVVENISAKEQKRLRKAEKKARKEEKERRRSMKSA